MRYFVAALFLVSVAAASSLVKRQIDDFPALYALPDGYEKLHGQFQSTFKCEGRNYGFYADVANDCKIFHVCNPIQFSDGLTLTARYSFFCGNQTVFDQQALVCSHPDDALSCAESEKFYNVNDLFGRTDVPFRQ